MKFKAIDKAEVPIAPKRGTLEQMQYDAAVASMQHGEAVAIDVDAEGDPKSIKNRLTRAAGRAGVKVKSWYDPQTAKVYAEIAE